MLGVQVPGLKSVSNPDLRSIHNFAPRVEIMS